MPARKPKETMARLGRWLTRAALYVLILPLYLVALPFLAPMAVVMLFLDWWRWKRHLHTYDPAREG